MSAHPGGPSRARPLVAPRNWLTNKRQSDKMAKKKTPNKTRTKSSHKSSGGERSLALDITLSPAGAELLRVAHMAPDPEALVMFHILRAGERRPAAKKGGGCCMLCNEPYTPARRPGRFASVRVAKAAPVMGVASVCAACLLSFPTDAELKRAVDSAAARAVATAIAKYGNQ